MLGAFPILHIRKCHVRVGEHGIDIVRCIERVRQRGHELFFFLAEYMGLLFDDGLNVELIQGKILVRKIAFDDTFRKGQKFWHKVAYHGAVFCSVLSHLGQNHLLSRIGGILITLHMRVGIEFFQDSCVLFKVLQIRKKALFFMKLLFVVHEHKCFFLQFCKLFFKSLIGRVDLLQLPFEFRVDFISWFYNSHKVPPEIYILPLL